MKAKKIYVTILSCLLTFSFSVSSAFAEETRPSITFDESYTINEALEDYKDKKNPGEGLTKADIEAAIERTNELNKGRAGGYSWQVKSMTTKVPYGIIKGVYSKKVASGQSLGSDTISITIKGTIKGVTLSASASFNKKVTFNGPSGSEKVGSNKATHRLFSGIAYGTIVTLYMEYKDNYTGHVASTKYENHITSNYMEDYANLAYINPSSGKVLIRSVGSSNTKSYASETTFKNAVNSSSSPDKVIDF